MSILSRYAARVSSPDDLFLVRVVWEYHALVQDEHFEFVARMQQSYLIENYFSHEIVALAPSTDAHVASTTGESDRSATTTPRWQ